MSKYFPYKPTNGILRYLYDKNQSDYYRQIYLEESSHFRSYIKTNAIDFQSDTYWTALDSGTKTLKICFNDFYVRLDSFELTTSGNECRPKLFGVDYSFDGNKFVGYKEISCALGRGEYQKFEFKVPRLKCFRHTSIESACPYGHQDVAQYEFFGTLFPNNFQISNRVIICPPILQNLIPCMLL